MITASYCTFAGTFATLALTFAGIAGETVPFERIAPKGSALVASARNFNETVRRVDESPIGQFFRAPELESALKPVREESAKARAEAYQELGVDLKEMPWPGQVGLSLFIAHNEELDAPEIGVLVFADYEERADDAAKVFDAVIRKMEKENGGKSFEEVDLAGGLKAKRVDISSGEDEGDEGAFGPMGAFVEMPEAMFYCRSASQFFLVSSLPALEDALEAASGKANSSVSDTEEWKGVQSMIDSPDMSIVIIPAPIEPLMEPMFAGPMASAKTLISKLFGGIKAVAWYGRIEEGAAAMSFGGAVFAPGATGGLMEIMAESTPVEPPPSLVGEHAVSFQRINVRFGKILELIESVIASLPDNEADMIDGMMDPFRGGLKEGLSSIGPAVWTISEAPAAGSVEPRTLTAMKCSNEKVANALLATLLPQAGMMPRDFKGQIVYSGESMPMEVGLGGGALLIGTPESVEQALRSASDPTAKSLSDDPMYRECAQAVTAGPVCAWGYVDLATQIDLQRKAALEGEKGISRLEDQPDDEDPWAVAMDNPYDGLIEAAYEKVDHAFLARFFGPIVWEVRSSEKGMVMKGQWLRPKPGS